MIFTLLYIIYMLGGRKFEGTESDSPIIPDVVVFPKILRKAIFRTVIFLCYGSSR